MTFSADDSAGRDERLVASFGLQAPTAVGNRLPAVSLSQADSILAVLARPATLPRYVHRHIKQLRIKTKQLQGDLVFGAKLPSMSLFQLANVDLPNVQSREQRQRHDSEQWMAQDHRQADPVVTIKPITIAGAGRRVVMNVGCFDAPPKSLGRRIVDDKRPVRAFFVATSIRTR